MAINVTLGEAKRQTEKTFPKLMISDDGRIVLFRAPQVGTVIYEKEPYYGIAHYAKCWCMEDFTDYNEPITLQNA